MNCSWPKLIIFLLTVGCFFLACSCSPAGAPAEQSRAKKVHAASKKAKKGKPAAETALGQQVSREHFQPRPLQYSSPKTTTNRNSSVITCFGLCDASAVVALNSNYFLVGDDEDNVLRVYHRAAGGFPVYSLNVSSFLRVDPNSPESDIEGADRLGDRIYWICSHGRNAAGKEAPSRQRFFATTGAISNGLIDLKPSGKPYAGLLGDLFADPRLVPFQLAAAAAKPPKSAGALNIEGLSATPDGHLLLGFRNPIPNDRALLVPLLNPDELLLGRPARFGDPILLDLHKRGIRSITLWHNHYVIIAGSSEQGGHSRLYLWDGLTQPQWIKSVSFTGLNPEAVSFWDESGLEQLYIVSDDGTEPVYGMECKKLKLPSLKSFRAVCLNPGAGL